MEQLQVIVSKQNLFYTWMANNNRLGGQYKVPRLDNSGEIFREIMQLNTS